MKSKTLFITIFFAIQSDFRITDLGKSFYQRILNLYFNYTLSVIFIFQFIFLDLSKLILRVN